ncbi:phage holin family protein [Peribacillus kribbensis]|uniref:phage holin family protein n=1 Tax=Peribacillus kribbensis TaxID=356658 RepID=UPI0004270345|nr:phage holin family protein [Peribacillus kribbensis]
MHPLFIVNWEGIHSGLLHTALYLAGGLDRFVLALFILTCCEGVTKNAAMLFTGTFSWEKSFRTAAAKPLLFILLTAANQLDIVMGNTGQYTRSAVLFFLIGNEGAGILENLDKLGLKGPSFIFHLLADLGGRRRGGDDSE